MHRESSPAKKAWMTRRTANYRARRTATTSQSAFMKWAEEHGWRVVFLDSLSGHPRTASLTPCSFACGHDRKTKLTSDLCSSRPAPPA